VFLSQACAYSPPAAQVRIVHPTEGSALIAQEYAGRATSFIEVEARGTFAKIALYLDGSLVSNTPWADSPDSTWSSTRLQLPDSSYSWRVQLPLVLPGCGPTCPVTACGGWHFVEVALIDADDWRLENSEAQSVVRFTLGCSGSVADAAAAVQQAAAEREHRERAGAFEKIYEEYGWEPSADSKKETRSGPGSYLARTEASRAFLSDVLGRYNISSMLDAGCGDVNWQGHTPGINDVDYFGIDIVPQMIADNERRLGGPGRRMRFSVKDVVKDELGGPYDLILCRGTHSSSSFLHISTSSFVLVKQVLLY
jgi:hypothetical protein